MVARFLSAALRNWSIGQQRARNLTRSVHSHSRHVEKIETKLTPPGSQQGSARAAHTLKFEANLDSVAQIVPYSSTWGAVKTFPKRRPFIFNLMMSGTLMPLADYNIQMVENGCWDKKRSLLFCFFGVYIGAAAWAVYVKVFSRIFPQAIRFSNLSWTEKLADRAGQKQLLGQCMADLLVYVPFVYFPAFYTFKAAVRGESVLHAIDTWRSNFFADNTASIYYWVPGDVLCFIAPAWLRMPVTHCVSYGWNMILSWGRGQFSSREQSFALD